MNSLRARIIDRKIVRNAVIQLQLSSTAATNNPTTEIKVPLRKERGPTDILRALETTVKRDPTAPDYKFIDDPYFIPSSLSKKRLFSLSKESGKRAAKWILEEHADLLRSNLSEPLIEAFLPPEKYETKEQVSEDILKKLIRQCDITKVLHVYKLLDKDVTLETKQEILELLCYFNSYEEQSSAEFPEEASFQVEAPINKNTWFNNPLVEELFGELQVDETTAAGAYNALICGTAKYLKVDKAWTLYNECIQKKLPIATTTYNYLITLVHILKDNVEDRKLLLTNLLTEMVKSGVKPNVGTLNAALKSVSTLQNANIAKDFALGLIAEFKSINVEPSLASYSHILNIFCRPSAPISNILLEILDDLEKREELKIQDPDDKLFFVNAMEVASKHMFNPIAGNGLHQLLLTKDNYKFIGGRLNESVYYRHYVQLMLQSESIDDFMKIYNILVPHIYIPEPAVMRDILEMLDLNENNTVRQYLPLFLSQIIMFDMLDRHQIMKLTYQLMMKLSSSPEKNELQELFTKTTLTFWNHYLETTERRLQRIMQPAQVFAHAAIILLHGNEFEKMLEILDHMVKNHDSFFGNMEQYALKQIFDACVTRGHVPGALTAIEYATIYGILDPNLMAEAIRKVTPLSETQENHLSKLIGSPTTMKSKKAV